jgi:small subunit ribosomal protein S7
MSRKGQTPKRRIDPDVKYGDRTIAKFINTIMRQGKKSTAERILYGALLEIERKEKDDPIKIFKKALENIKPVVEVKSRRVGGATYQVPVEIKPERRNALAMRWMIQYAKDRGDKTMMAKLAAELIDAANQRGGAIKKKEDVHKMAEANKAFAHYRW